jgi:signal peptide peptidase SppA
MTHTHLINAVFAQPWLVTPSAHHAVAELVKAHVLSPTARQREGTDICGGAVELESMTVEEGVAFIPVGGVIGRKLTGFEKGAGAVDVYDVETDLDEAEDDPRVSAIFLVFDSPGGMVNGTPELAERIEQSTKPVYAWVSGMACSAAYWLACACEGIFATKTAEVGSVGVYIPWIDQSKAFENAGLSSEPITSGPLKALGFPGTSLSEEQRAHLQESVDKLAANFKGYVNARRGGEVPDEMMHGQSVMADDALDAGMIDGIYRSLAECVSDVIGTAQK